MTFQRLALPAAALIASTIAVGASAPDLFDDIYARGKSLEASIQTLSARFTETSHSPLLVRPLVASGTLSVVRPSRVAMHYTAPERRAVIIDGGSLRVVWPSQGIDRRTAIGAAEKRIQQYFVGRTPEQLRDHFAIVAQHAPEPKTWFVSMTPRRKQIREGLSRLELWIDQDSVMLSQMQMIFPGGDIKRLTFTDVRVNPAIDEAVFKFGAP